MTQSGGLALGPVGPAKPLRLLADLAQSARYSVSNTIADLAAVARLHAVARYEMLRGRPEAALLEYGRAIRHVKLARQSMATYAAVERLIRRHPVELASYRVPAVQPQRFVFFVGYSRSGHSLVGSLLDAHPNVLIAHELHAAKHLIAGHTPDQVMAAIQRNSHFFEQFGRGYSGYSYEIASQWQGRHADLHVIGDKKANGTCGLLRRNPAIVEQLERLLPMQFLFVHVIRNPFDNIASRARRVGTSLDFATYGYFANVETIDRLRRHRPELVVDVYLDDLIASPKSTLSALLRRLGIVDVSEQYLVDCAALVFADARRTGDGVDWDPGLKSSILERLGRYDFLARFADEP